MTTRRADDPSRKPPLSDDELLSAITQDLRAIYSDIIRRPLPDELAAALRRLEAAMQREKAPPSPAAGGLGAATFVTGIDRTLPRAEMVRRAS